MLTTMTQAWKQIYSFILFGVILLFVSHYSSAATCTEGIQIYHRNLRLHPEHVQRLADDISRYRHADNMWDVLSEEFSLTHYEYHPAVQEKIAWFMYNQEYLYRSAQRAAPYLYYILQQVKKRHLPAEIVLLPIIESGYNPFSRSYMGAAGIWQLMPNTAAGLGIRQDRLYDGRRDVIASTNAALNHLAYLQNFFDGNWLLALAAYNTGEGNVLFAIKRNIRYGMPTDFWSLPVAQQTKDYVPSLLALAVIISHPGRYPVYLPPVKNAPYLAQVDIGKQIDLKYAASLAGISYRKLIQLNPGFNQPVTTRRRPYKLVIPIENVEQFSENLAHSPFKTKIEWQHYIVKTGDSLYSVSKKFKTTVVAIQKMNHLSNSTIHHGMKLLIPNAPAKRASKSTLVAKSNKRLREVLGKNSNYSLKSGDTIYMIRKKDTFSRIASRFNVSIDELMSVNHLNSSHLITGKKLIIPTHRNFATAGKLLPGDTIYMVRHGDTIEKIATRFQTTASAIRLANLLDSNSVEEGEKLVVPTHLRS